MTSPAVPTYAVRSSAERTISKSCPSSAAFRTVPAVRSNSTRPLLGMYALFRVRATATPKLTGALITDDVALRRSKRRAALPCDVAMSLSESMKSTAYISGELLSCNELPVGLPNSRTATGTSTERGVPSAVTRTIPFPSAPNEVTTPLAETLTSAGVSDVNWNVTPGMATLTASRAVTSSRSVRPSAACGFAGITTSRVGTCVTATGTSTANPALETVTDARPDGPRLVTRPVDDTEIRFVSEAAKVIVDCGISVPARSTRLAFICCLPSWGTTSGLGETTSESATAVTVTGTIRVRPPPLTLISPLPAGPNDFTTPIEETETMVGAVDSKLIATPEMSVPPASTTDGMSWTESSCSSETLTRLSRISVARGPVGPSLQANSPSASDATSAPRPLVLTRPPVRIRSARFPRLPA